MAHEIRENDGLVLFKDAAWHGLGTVVEHAPTPMEAMKLANLDWNVNKNPLFTKLGDDLVYVPENFALTRSDDNSVLSIVGNKYTIIQNNELFDLAGSISDTVKVESAGSLFGGQKIFCLLKGDTINFKHDCVDTYLAILNSHNGMLPLSAMPTSVRVVCNNTLNMALKSDNSKMFRIRHTATADQRIVEMKKALQKFKATSNRFTETVEELRSSEIKGREDLYKFFSAAILKVTGKQELDDKQKDTFKPILEQWESTFEIEQMTLGENANLWLAGNAVTSWLQKKEPERKMDGWEERRFEANFFGKNDSLSAEIMELCGEFARA